MIGIVYNDESKHAGDVGLIELVVAVPTHGQQKAGVLAFLALRSCP